jgi:hypothetical protein
MTKLDELLLHKESCETCKANPVGTKFAELKLCKTGKEIRARLVSEEETGEKIRFVLVAASIIIGSVLIGETLGREVGMGALLLVLSTRIEVF